VANLSRVWVMAQVFGADLAAVSVGDAAEVNSGIGSKTFSGKVDNIAALVDPDTRAVAVRVVVDNPGDLLKKQMYVRVRLEARQESRGLLVPVSAILRDDENLPFVYQLQADGSLARRHVTLGSRTGDAYDIAEGLSAADKIVVDGASVSSVHAESMSEELPPASSVPRTGSMMNRIVASSLRQRFLVGLMTLLLIGVGSFSLRRLPVDAYPDLAPPMVEVITQWPGRAAEEIERLITVPVEREMNGIPRLSTIRSISLYGLSDVILTFQNGTDNYFARQEVFNRFSELTLPPA
jgi:hypothetical protein